MTKTHLVFSCQSENDDADDWKEHHSSILGALTPLHHELMSGDFRALYLSWLLRRQAGEIRRTDKAPACLPDMKRMTGSQMPFAEILRIDLSGL